MPLDPLLFNRPDEDGRDVLSFAPANARHILAVCCSTAAVGRVLQDRGLCGLEPEPQAAHKATPHYRQVYLGLFLMMCLRRVVRLPRVQRLLEHLVDPYAALRACRELLPLAVPWWRQYRTFAALRT